MKSYASIFKVTQRSQIKKKKSKDIIWC